MRTLIRTIVLASLFGCFTLPSQAQAQWTPYFEQDYDRFKDITYLKARIGTIYVGPQHRVSLSVFQTFRGNGRDHEVRTSFLYFLSNSRDSWVYLKFHPITLLVDEERIKFTPDHEGDVGKGYVLEFLHVFISETHLKKLASARKIEGQIGNNEFRLDRDQVAAIKEFVALATDPKRKIPEGQFRAPKTPEEAAREAASQREESFRAEEERQLRDQERKRRKEAELNSKLDRNLKLAKTLEKLNPKAAIGYYKEVIELAPASQQAETAKARIQALEKK